ncbi:hypothetical protein [Nannocystis pusilla]|uniref:hypothetical protein n=1 Tax=Nannocystis pusilla TaxID=889268 RepID=UPI003BF1AD04
MPARRRTALALVSAALLACTPEKGETTATDATTGSATGTTTGATTDATDATTASVTTVGDPPPTGGTTEPAASSSESTTTAAGTSTGGDSSDSETTTGTATSSSTSGDTTDTGDVALCEGTSMSSLPGVTIVFPPQPCTFTVAEVHGGVVFHYEVHVEAALPDVLRYRQDAGGCDEPGASGLIVAPRIFGGDEMYCFCNQGLCPGLDIPPITLQPGVYPGELEWKGWNWQGPHVDLGPAFSPGEYIVQERAIGSFKSNGADVDYEVLAQLPITLLP